MVLGELYKSVGYALETAQHILDCKDVYSCNVAWGCTNGCLDCYGQYQMHCTKEEWHKVHRPKQPPARLIAMQFARMLPIPEGIFFSYLTDPLLAENILNTQDAIHEIQLKMPNTRIAVLSKTARLRYIHPPTPKLRYGATIVSLDEAYREVYEPNGATIRRRIDDLQDIHDRLEGHTFVSMEPYPVSAIHKQDLEKLLESLDFVDSIVFGKRNYDPRAATPEAKLEYQEYVAIFREFCSKHNIRGHVKQETLRFIGASP
jgi:DNA repair photolyase